MNTRFVCLALGLFLCGKLMAGTMGYSDPAQLTQEAYIALVQADQFLEDGQMAPALQQYTLSLELYDQVSMQFPDWEPRIIQYRKTYCANQITDIERRQNTQRPLVAEEPLKPSAAIQSATTSQEGYSTQTSIFPVAEEAPIVLDRSAELDHLRKRVQQLELEMATYEEQISLMEDLEAENQSLKESAEQTRQSMSAMLAVEREKMDDLLEEMAEMEAAMITWESQKELQKQLDDALREMEEERNQAQAENTQLLEEMERLTFELDEVESTSEKANQIIVSLQEQLQTLQAQLQASSMQNGQMADLQNEIQRLQGENLILQKKQEKTQPTSATASKTAPSSDSVVDRAPVQDSVKKNTTPTSDPVTAKPTPEKISRVDGQIAPPLDTPPIFQTLENIRSLLKKGDNEAALSLIRKAKISEPTNVDLLLNEGIALIRLQDYTEAAQLLNELALQQTRNPEVHATLGAAMMGAGLYSEARETLQKAIKLDPNLPEAQYNLAQLYAFTEPKNLKRAKQAYQLAIKLGAAPDPQLAAALRN